MKAIDYVDKYNLHNTFKFDRASFVVDFMAEFDLELPEYKGMPDMMYVIFQAAVSNAKELWDDIFIDTKVSKEHSDKFWGFVYASEIIPRRNKFVPKYPREFDGSTEHQNIREAL
jgi:hypothetical protein